MTRELHASPRDRTNKDIVEMVRSGRATTRAELADATGLARSTINGAVGRLLSSGRLQEGAALEKGRGSGSGRPGVRLGVPSSGRLVAGIDFGHNHVSVALGDAHGSSLDERRVELDVDLDAEGALRAAEALLRELVAAHGAGTPDVVAAGVPGPLDHHSGLVQSPTILSSWVGTAPQAELERRLGAPVLIANDAVLGARGELAAGAGRDHRDVLYVKASHGIGAALVTDGSPYTGATGLAGEIGHTQLPAHTELCRCGNRGCLEAVVSVQSIHEQLRHTHPRTDPALLTITDAADAVSERILNEAGLILGTVLATLCNLVNPSAVIIGGELGGAHPVFIEGVEQALRRHAQPATSAALQVCPAQLGVRAELVGALDLAASAVTG